MYKIRHITQQTRFIQSEELKVELATKINKKLNLPFLNEEQEQELLEKLIDWVTDILEDLAKKTRYVKYYKSELEDPLKILFDSNRNTFIKDAKGSFGIKRGKESSLRINTSSLGMNGLTTGSIDLLNNNFNGVSKFIFLTGTKKRQNPLNVAISYNGPIDSLLKNANLDQIKQYVDKFK